MSDAGDPAVADVALTVSRECGSSMTDPESASPAPSLERLRARWIEQARRASYASRQALLTECAAELLPFLDHERSLVAEIQRLELELFELQKHAENVFRQAEDDLRLRKAAEATVQRLTDALKTYGRHAEECESNRCQACSRLRVRGCHVSRGKTHAFLGGVCTCGLTDALIAHEKEGKA